MCVVDDHGDALFFLRACYRARLLPPSGAVLLHVDAHPDMSCPSISFSTCDVRDKQRVADLVNAEGGISEFILPMLYPCGPGGARVISRVQWLKSCWSDQFAIGGYTFLLGDSPNIPSTMGVTLAVPYYLGNGGVNLTTLR
jgi:hypothetical protein